MREILYEVRERDGEILRRLNEAIDNDDDDEIGYLTHNVKQLGIFVVTAS